MKDPEGNICRFEARLCARGFMQQQGFNFTETFAPVVRYDSLRVFLSIVAHEDYELVQFNVETAFLHGELTEEISMEIPEGPPVSRVSESEKKNMVSRLRKSLYGLKQALRCWNDKFCKFLERFNFKETEADKCIFTGHIEGSVVMLALFVDDGLIAAKSIVQLNSVLNQLRKEFNITIGDSSIFVGMQIERYRVRKSVFLYQQSYIEKSLIKFGMKNAKQVAVPAAPHVTVYPVEENDLKSENVPYSEAVGTLMFVAVVSRPDIAFSS